MIPIRKTAVRLAGLAGLARNTAPAVCARSACRYERQDQDTLRCMQETHTRPRAGRGGTSPGQRAAPLLPHALHAGRARAGDRGARGMDYDHAPRRGDGELMRWSCRRLIRRSARPYATRLPPPFCLLLRTFVLRLVKGA